MTVIVDYFYSLVSQFLNLYQRTIYYKEPFTAVDYLPQGVDYLDLLVLCFGLTSPGLLILYGVSLAKSNAIYKVIVIVVLVLFSLFLFRLNSSDFSMLSLFLLIVVSVILMCYFSLIRFAFSLFLFTVSLLSFPLFYSTALDYVYSFLDNPEVLPLHGDYFISSLLYSAAILAPFTLTGFYGIFYKKKLRQTPGRSVVG